MFQKSTQGRRCHVESFFIILRGKYGPGSLEFYVCKDSGNAIAYQSSTNGKTWPIAVVASKLTISVFAKANGNHKVENRMAI